MPAIITNKFRFYNAYQFMENFKDVPVQDSGADGDPNIGLSRSKFYLFVGKSTPWDENDGFLQPRLTGSQHNGTPVGTNYPFVAEAGLPGPAAEQYDDPTTAWETADEGSDTNPPTPYDTVSNEMQTWDEVLAAKNIGSADVSFVIPRYDWISGETYAAYDDADTYLFEKPFYVLNRDYRVYKCIDNNNNATVTDEPFTTEDDKYIKTSDGYIWKFMYSISPADVVKFVTPEWIPVQTIYNYDEKSANSYQLAQSNVQANAVDGDITRLVSIAANSVGTPAADENYTVKGDGNSVSAIQTDGQLSIATAAIIGDSTPFRGDVDVVLTSNGNSAATTRAVVSPRGGHGFDPVRELGGFYVMVNTRLEYDQSGSIFVDNDFRKIGLLSDPLTPAGGHITYGSSGDDLTGGIVNLITDASLVDITTQVYDIAEVPAGFYDGVAVDGGSGSGATVDFQVEVDTGAVLPASIVVRNSGTNYTVDDHISFAIPTQVVNTASAGSAVSQTGAYGITSVLGNVTDFRRIPGEAFAEAIADQRAVITISNALTDSQWDLLELGVDGLVDFEVANTTGGSARILNVVRPTDYDPTESDNAGSVGGTLYVAGVTGTIAADDALTITTDGGGVGVDVASFTDAALLHDSGDILYVEHRRPIVRASDQIEDIKLIIEF